MYIIIIIIICQSFYIFDSVKLFGEGGTKKGRTFVIINLITITEVFHMDIISHFNHFVEENFNKFLKNYFFHSNYWNKLQISLKLILNISIMSSFIPPIVNSFVNLKAFIKELFLLSLVKSLINDDIIMTKNIMIISSLLISF